VKLEVVTVGTELLLGYTLDSNGADLGRELAAAGIEIVRRTSVADRADAIHAAIAQALERTGTVIATGGLGPTSDDLTKDVVAKLLGRRLVLDPTVLTALEARFKRLGRWPMPASNRGQAEVPEGATVLPNSRGTAPGLWLEEGDRLVVLLPGVPREMRGLLADEVLPRLAKRTRGAAARVVRSKTVRTTGVAESALAERVAAVEATLAPLSLAYLPSVLGVDLRLTAWDMEAHEADAQLTIAAGRLAAAVGEDAYGEDEADLAAIVLERLRARHAQLGIAESCTGGLIAQRVTAVPGASDTFIGGVVAYADAVKTAELKVPPEVISAHGAVSEETVRAMVAGAERLFAVEAAVAVTGIAGPGGGTPEKPVGTVWLAAGIGPDVRAVRRLFVGDRDEIRSRAAQAALDLLRRQLLQA